MTNTDHGYAGELLVQSNLITQGVVPFMTTLSNSEVDLIGLKDNKSYKIQVKTSKCCENGSLKFDVRKTNRKTKDYGKDSFDILALVDIERGKVAYLKWEEIYPRQTIRMRTSEYSRNMNENFGNKGYQIFEDYLTFPIHTARQMVQ